MSLASRLGVIPFKEVFRPAPRLHIAGFLSQAGKVGRPQCAGNFRAAVPRSHWPEDESHIERVWEEENGDCRQELVLIGSHMDEQGLVAMLDHRLLTQEELATNETRWNEIFETLSPGGRQTQQ